MKNITRLTSLFLLIILAVATLASCTQDGGEVASRDDIIFSEEVDPILIFGDATDNAARGIVYQAIKEATGEAPIFDSDVSEEQGHEIVVGETSRAISKKAYRQLRKVATDEGETAFVIYASGSSVAIAYDEDYSNVTLLHAVNRFVENYVVGRTELRLDAGVVMTDTVNADEYFRERDEKYKNGAWEKLATYISGAHGEQIIEGLRALYAVYDPSLIGWLADLYEPYNCICGECTGDVACGGGGFYYSNSGRDTHGFGIDAESTYQALSTLAAAGLSYDLNGKFTSITPEWMGEQMVAFARSLQHIDGFFYHPTWGPESVNNLRRGRDLAWCEAILSAYGAKPKYTTPNGMRGDSAITSPLGTSVAYAASRVVSTAAIPEHLSSREALLAYLDEISAGVKSFYGVGSTIGEEMGQIIMADAALRAEGNVDYSLVDIVVEWFNDRQDPETGLWLHTSSADAIDGVLKIANVYAAAQREFPHAYEAAETAIGLLISDSGVGNIVQIYNPWSSVCKLIENMTAYGRTLTVDGVELTGRERAELIRVKMYELMPAALARTVANISEFKKSDGSFSFAKGESASTSCGMPVAVIGTNEGDVNSTYLLIAGVNDAIYTVLGVPNNAKVPLFGSLERKMFVDKVSALGPVEKIEDDTETVIPDPYDFEPDAIGTTPAGFSGSYASGGFGKVVASPSGEGRAINFVSRAGSGEYFFTDLMLAEKNGDSVVYSADVYVDGKDTSSGTFMQMIFADVAMVYLQRSGNTVNIVESSARDNPHQRERYLTSVKTDEWFSLELRYYAGDARSTRLCWYVNGELVAVTNNFFSYNGNKLGTSVPPPALKSNARMTFYVLSSQNSSVFFDNVCAYLIKDKFTPRFSDSTVYNIDDTEQKVTHTFDSSLPESITPQDPTLAVVKDGVLELTGKATMVAQNTFSGGACLVFEADITAPTDIKAGEYLSVSFLEEWRDRSPVSLSLRCVGEGDERHLAIYDASGASRVLSGARIALDGSSHSLRIEYYHNSQMTVYIDGELAANVYSQLEIESKGALRYYPETLVLAAKSIVTLDNLAFYYCDGTPLPIE
jgi:hypothetical protein